MILLRVSFNFLRDKKHLYSIALNRIKLNVLLIMDFIMFIFECPAPFSVNLAGDVEYLGAKALLPLLSGSLLMISLATDSDQQQLV